MGRGQAVFDVERLGEAHAHCRHSFTQALERGAGLVIVDNTNSTLGEYAFYRRLALRSNYSCDVLELRLPEPDLRAQLEARGTHAVPPTVYDAMQGRWEEDEDAILLAPAALGPASACWDQETEDEQLKAAQQQQEDDDDDDEKEEEKGEGEEGSLARWLSAHRCFHFSKTRPKSHLHMAVGAAPAQFVWVPPALREEFARVYASDPSPHKFLAELIDSPDQRFNFFMDVDLDPACFSGAAAECFGGGANAGERERMRGLHEALRVARAVQEVLAARERAASGEGGAGGEEERPEVLLTGAQSQEEGGGRPGFHVHVRTCQVTCREALEVRVQVVARLSAEDEADRKSVV